MLRESLVLGQSPARGATRPSGTKIVLVVGNGPRTGKLPSSSAAVSTRLPPYIAYDPPAGGIWFVKPNGADAHEVGPQEGNNPVWSPDAKEILYQAPAQQNDQGVTTDTYVMNADGTDQHPIMPSAGGEGVGAWSDVGFHWSADGKRIVFTKYFWDSSAIEIANADGSDPHAVPIGVNGVAASFSPDGNHLVFVDSSAENNPTPTRWGIYAVKPDGKGLRRMTFDGGVDAPSWSPDGHRVIYSCLENNSGFHGICELSGKRGRQRILHANKSQTFLHPSWNANGRKIIVTVERNQNGPGQIAFMSPTSGRLVKTGILLAAGTHPDW
jgi:Tol biopolymer transport system component